MSLNPRDFTQPPDRAEPAPPDRAPTPARAGVVRMPDALLVALVARHYPLRLPRLIWARMTPSQRAAVPARMRPREDTPL